MYIHGQFYGRYGKVCEVRILTGGDTSEEVEIGADGSILQWGDAPVQIDSEVNDTFDVLLRHSATVSLQSAAYIPDLYAADPLDVVVNILVDGVCLFAGFADPRSFDQPYAEKWDDIEICCIDVLSALQYYNYGNVGQTGYSWSALRAASEQVTFLSALEACLSKLLSSLCIAADTDTHVYYDVSKLLSSDSIETFGAFQVSVSEILFYGDEEDDVMTKQEVVEEVLRYLNLHIVQFGFDFYIFDWGTVRAGGDVTWHDLFDGTTLTTSATTVTLSHDVVEDDKASIEVGEIYSRLELTADVKALEDVVESPLDEDDLESPFNAKQKFMTEMFSLGEGKTSCKAFTAMLLGDTPTYEDAYERDHYMRVMTHPRWTINLRGSTGEVVTLDTDAEGTYQWYHAMYLRTYPMSAGLLQLGNIEWQPYEGGPTGSPEMSTCLTICVGGGECNESYNNGGTLTEEIEKARIPVAEYTGAESTGSLSPSDDDTTNYIVISGKVALMGCYKESGSYYDLSQSADADKDPEDQSYWHSTVYSRESEDTNGRYYTQEHWKAVNPTDEPEVLEGGSIFVTPYLGEWAPRFPDNKSYTGKSSATIGKLRVLACMLIVGDKVCVEHSDTSNVGSTVSCSDLSGDVSEYTWQTYKPLDECDSEDEYYAQCIYIGVKPGYDNYIIDEEYEILDNVTADMNIDATGTAIPIKKSDGVSGAVTFKILGPVQAFYDYDTSAYGCPVPFYARNDDEGDPRFLMDYVSNIFVTDLEVKIYSDNAGYEAVSGDGEIVYYSDEATTFVNVKDDLSFAITTALTSEECYALDVANGVNVSTATYDGANLESLYDVNAGETAKPEELYVNAYYPENSAAKVVLTQNMQDRDGLVSPWNLYTHTAIGKTFYVQGISYSLIDSSAELTLKEQ